MTLCCLIPTFCHIPKMGRELTYCTKKNGERAWPISSCVQWHTMCVFLYMVWIFELLPMHAVIERSTMLETESPCWLSQHLMLLNMIGRSPWEATTNKCESCHAEKWPWKLHPHPPIHFSCHSNCLIQHKCRHRHSFTLIIKTKYVLL